MRKGRQKLAMLGWGSVHLGPKAPVPAPHEAVHWGLRDGADGTIGGQRGGSAGSARSAGKAENSAECGAGTSNCGGGAEVGGTEVLG